MSCNLLVSFCFSLTIAIIKEMVDRRKETKLIRWGFIKVQGLHVIEKGRNNRIQ